MRVRLTVNLGGTHAATPCMAGSVIDFPDETALYLIEQGQAEPVDEVRTAVVEPPRNAAARTAKPPVRRK